MDESYYVAPNEEVQRFLVTAKKAQEHLGRCWEYHLDMGRALYEYKQQLYRQIPVPNDPDTKFEDQQKYRSSMSEFLHANGLHEDDKDPPWSKPQRAALLNILEHLEKVEEFRQWYHDKHGKDRLRRFNDPANVWRQLEYWAGLKKKKEKPTRQDETLRLVRVLDTVCDRLHVGTSGEYSELLERVERFDGTDRR